MTSRRQLLQLALAGGLAGGLSLPAASRAQAATPGLRFDGTRLENYSHFYMQGYTPPTARGSQIVQVDDMLRFDLHDEDTTSPTVVRIQAETREPIVDGDEIWLVNEIMLPDGFPSIVAPHWLGVGSIFGPPFNGSGPHGLGVRDFGQGNCLAWTANGNIDHGDEWQVMWQSPPLQPGQRYTTARRIKMSPDATIGFAEVWFAPRGEALQQQRLRQAGVMDAVARRYYATIDASNNGGPNTTRITFYHDTGNPGFAGKVTSLFHAEHRVWDATVVGLETVDPARRLDPEPPTVPQRLTASAITDRSLTLAWTPSTDNVGVSGYEVLVDGVLATTSTGPSAQVSGLRPRTTYRLTVRAFDKAGNRSTVSSALRVTTRKAVR